jgi:hypothetical protein
MDINGLETCIQEVAGDSLYLNEIRKNPTAHLERSPLTHRTAMGRRAIVRPGLPDFP